MMNPGADTDIVSGKPKEMIADNKAIEKQIKDKERWQNQADFLGLSQSPDGQKIIEMVQEQLIRRIDEMVNADPKAQAFVQILSELGIKEVLAQKAVKRLVEMKIGKNES